MCVCVDLPVCACDVISTGEWRSISPDLRCRDKLPSPGGAVNAPTSGVKEGNYPHKKTSLPLSPPPSRKATRRNPSLRVFVVTCDLRK